VNEDRDVLAAAMAGDPEAFNALVRPHLTHCYRVACLITHNEADASDALQNALFRAHQSLGNVQLGRPFYPWFLIESQDRPDPTPEDELIAFEERQALRQAVQSLSPKHRAVIVLRYFEDIDEREMAQVLGVSPGTVKSRLHYARRALEKQLRSGSSNWLFRLALHSFARGGSKHE
jgi:RNA polymerase sigma-70 factor (ECF subfamily)